MLLFLLGAGVYVFVFLSIFHPYELEFFSLRYFCFYKVNFNKGLSFL